MNSSQPPHEATHDLPSRHLDGSRLWRRIDDLARIGATPEGGVDRPALSGLEAEARRQVIDWASQAGIPASIDPIGNLFFRLEGRQRGWPAVYTGSYLDTQPGGGKYSGAYGMLAGIEALAAIAEYGRRPQRSVVVACWMNGEGSRFQPGYMGSEAFAGLRSEAHILTTEDDAGHRVADELASMLAAQGHVTEIPLGQPAMAYVETHLEQGPVIETSGKHIGIVTGIQGVRRSEIRVTGEAAHNGTTLNEHKRDALRSTVKIIAALDQFFAAPDVGFAVSQLRVKPNAPSIVPQEAVFSLALRHRDNGVLTRLGDTIGLICESEKARCQFKVTELASIPAIAFAPLVPCAIEQAADRLGITHTPILSLGGHDAQSLHHHCPSGIIFIPCKGGVSHNPAEQITPEHAVYGAKVLTDVLWDLANAWPAP